MAPNKPLAYRSLRAEKLRTEANRAERVEGLARLIAPIATLVSGAAVAVLSGAALQVCLGTFSAFAVLSAMTAAVEQRKAKDRRSLIARLEDGQKSRDDAVPA